MKELRWQYVAILLGVLVLACPLIVLANGPATDFQPLISAYVPRANAAAVSPDGQSLYVIQRADPNDPPLPPVLAKLDAHSLETIETLTLPNGLGGHVALSPDGKRAYVALSGRAGSDLFGKSQVVMVDTAACTITGEIVFESDYFVTRVAPHPQEEKLYVTSRSAAGKVYVLEAGPSALTLTQTIDVGDRPVGLAVTPDGTRVYVANRGSGTVSVIDTASDTVSDTLDSGLSPTASATNIAISPDGSMAYVAYSSYQESGEWVGQYRFSVLDTDPASPSYHTTEIITTTGERLQDAAFGSDGAYGFLASQNTGELLVLDTATHDTLTQIDLEGPSALATGPDRNTVYVLSTSAGRVTKVKMGRFHVEEQQVLPRATRLLALHPDGQRLYVLQGAESTGGGMMPGKVAVLDPLTLEPTDVLTLPAGHPSGLALSPDGAQLYASLSRRAGANFYGRDRLVIVDTDLFSITEDLDYNSDDFARVAAHPDGRRVYVTLRRSAGRVYVFDAISRTLEGQIGVGTEPIGLAITPDGSRVYVANRRDATLSVIETTSDTVTTTLDLPIESCGSGTSVAITPDGKKAYVTYSIYNDGSGWVGQYRLVVVDVDPASPTYHAAEVITTTGARLEYVAISADGAYALVTSGDTDELLFLDTATDAEVERAYTGDHPFGVTGDLDPGVAYVANTDGTVVRIARARVKIFLPFVLRQ